MKCRIDDQIVHELHKRFTFGYIKLRCNDANLYSHHDALLVELENVPTTCLLCIGANHEQQTVR